MWDMIHFFLSITLLLAAGVAQAGPLPTPYATTAQSTNLPLTLAVPPDVINDCNAFLNGRDPLAVKHFTGPHARRDVVELILVQQALAAGGMTGPVDLLPTASYERLLTEVERANALLTGNSVWLQDIRWYGGDMQPSTALIPEGKFEAGFYTSETNVRALSVRNVQELRTLRAVSCSSWRPDWAALEALQPATLLQANTWEDIIRILGVGRADYTLAPFANTPELAMETQGVRLLPIPGLKTSLSGSRHIAVSMLHPLGHKTLKALDRGLRILRKNGVIERAYQECGFYNRDVKDWQTLP